MVFDFLKDEKSRDRARKRDNSPEFFLCKQKRVKMLI